MREVEMVRGRRTAAGIGEYDRNVKDDDENNDRVERARE
jgi:hypothetical protein